MNLLNRRFIFLFGVLILALSLPSFSQEAGEFCTEITDAKVIKLYKAGIDKKEKKEDRMKSLKECLALEPDFVEANYIYAFELVRTYNYHGTSLSPTEPYFAKVIELCPKYHSDPYYYLGTIQLEKERYKEAVENLKKFIDFSDDDDNKFAKDYDEKIIKAKEAYQVAKFYHEVYSNPVPFDPVVVKTLSTPADEYLPIITPDNEALLFTRRFVKEVKIRQTVYETDKREYLEKFAKAKRESKYQFDNGLDFSSPFNENPDHNYGGASISIDNKHIFLTVCKMEKMNYFNCDLYSTDYVYGSNPKTFQQEWYWTDLQNLGPEVNTEDGWEAQPSISADGQTLYFATYRAESKGIDIYKTDKLPTGGWSKATSLGAPINTEYNDKTPFIHSDSHTLYFASDGHLGFGKYDVFYSRADDKGVWQEPKNIGSPINNEVDQHGFVVSTDGTLVYFSSDEIKDKGVGGLDIFSFELYKEARPDKVLFLKGAVKNDDGEIAKNATIEVKDAKTNEVLKFKADSTDGSYAAVVRLKKGHDVVLSVKADSMAFNSTIIEASDANMQTENIFVEKNLMVEEVVVGKPFRINDIHYKTNSAELMEISKEILEELFLYLKENPSYKIAIHGHTDNVGSDSDNLALSTDRAYSVKAYLLEKGIEKTRLTFQGFGESKPISSNDTEEGRLFNRRTEFVVLEK